MSKFALKRQRLLKLTYKAALRITENYKLAASLSDGGRECPISIFDLEEDTTSDLDTNDDAKKLMQSVGYDSMETYIQMLNSPKWNKKLTNGLKDIGCISEKTLKMLGKLKVDPIVLGRLLQAVFNEFKRVVNVEKKKGSCPIRFTKLKKLTLKGISMSSYVQTQIKKLGNFSNIMALGELLKTPKWNAKVIDFLTKKVLFKKDTLKCVTRTTIRLIKVQSGQDREYEGIDLSRHGNHSDHGPSSCSSCTKQSGCVLTCPDCGHGRYCNQSEFEQDWEDHKMLYHDVV